MEKYEITIYSSCCNQPQNKGIYYYTSYNTNQQINRLWNMTEKLLDSKELIKYKLMMKKKNK